MSDPILSSLSFKCYLVITVTTDGSSNNAYILVTQRFPLQKDSCNIFSGCSISVCCMGLDFQQRETVELHNY